MVPLQGTHPGSSAGEGEQPKFCTILAVGLPGRVGMVSLQVYDAEYVGEMGTWAATANRMAARQLLSQADAQTLRLL